MCTGMTFQDETRTQRFHELRLRLRDSCYCFDQLLKLGWGDWLKHSPPPFLSTNAPTTALAIYAPHLLFVPTASPSPQTTIPLNTANGLVLFHHHLINSTNVSISPGLVG